VRDTDTLETSVVPEEDEPRFLILAVVDDADADGLLLLADTVSLMRGVLDTVGVNASWSHWFTRV
jgi:hypothetical protein